MTDQVSGVAPEATTGFVPPPYPYDRLDELKPLAEGFEGGLVDFSIGTPMDPPTGAVIAALGGSGLERGYPPSIGRPELRDAIGDWMQRRLGVTVDPATEIAAAIGTKEFVAGLPHWRSAYSRSRARLGPQSPAAAKTARPRTRPWQTRWQTPSAPWQRSIRASTGSPSTSTGR